MPVQVVFVVTATQVDHPKISQFSLVNLMLPFTSCLGCTLCSYMLAYVLVSVLLIGTYNLYPLVVLVRSRLCRQCMLVFALCAPCGGFRIRHIESTPCPLYWPVLKGIVPQKTSDLEGRRHGTYRGVTQAPRGPMAQYLEVRNAPPLEISATPLKSHGAAPQGSPIFKFKCF